MLLLVVYVLVALAVSFVCSILEAVLLSITPAYVSLLEEQKHRAAAAIRALRADVERPLAAILSLNTIAHTVGAAGAGAQAAKVFGDAAVGVFSGVLTLLILVLTEIIPKTLGAVHWKRLAPLAARVLRVLIVTMWPLVQLARWLTTLLTPKERAGTVSREEIAALADEGKREGVVGEGESRVLKNLLRLARLKVCHVMTPADHVLAFDGRMPLRQVLEKHPELEFSRIPIYSEREGRRSWDAYVLKDAMLEGVANDNHEAPVSSLGRDLLVVPMQTPLPKVFDQMAERREHIGLAIDERGEMVGVITMEDIIETLLGVEIYDEVDDEEKIHSLGRSHWSERAARLGRHAIATSEERVKLGLTGTTHPTSEDVRRADEEEARSVA